MVDCLLTAIGHAFHTSTTEKALYLDLIGHGRDFVSSNINLSRTVGWFTEQIPIVIPISQSPKDTLLEVSKLRIDATKNGRLFRSLKHLDLNPQVIGQQELKQVPDANISLNIILPSEPDANVLAAATESKHYNHNNFHPDSQRMYEISGGVYFTDERLNFSWDFSNQLYNQQSIREFSLLCKSEYQMLLSQLLSLA